MEILRVLNNNVVLARDDAGTDVVLSGRGLGFQARPGQRVDPARVTRTFRPSDGRDPDHLAQLVAGIPPEALHLVADAMTHAGLADAASSNPALVIALADHISFAARRLALGMVVDYPLTAEVKHLYPDEFAAAGRLLTAVNTRLPTPLPDSEAVALSLHLVNAGFATGDLAFTYTMTGVIQQMVAVIEGTYRVRLDHDSVSVGRFVTHLRFLFVRIHSHRQLDDEHSPIGVAIRAAYPDALAVARRLAAIVELRLGAPVTQDELSYLTLHVARLAADFDVASAAPDTERNR